MNFKITVAYDGTRYNGWQRQGNTSNTIAEKFETLLSKLFGEAVEINSSGRTDAGVHARGQVCNFKVSDNAIAAFCENEQMPLDGSLTADHLHHIQMQINHYLPCDIAVTSLTKADERFHARLLAKAKHYSYTIDRGEVPDIFLRKYTTRITEQINLSPIRKAIPSLIGEHDFASFCTKSGKKKSTIRRIDKIDITETKGLVRFDIYGNGFLYNMIRIIMGTLIEIGAGKRSVNDIPRILAAKKRAEAGFLAPPQGLCLEQVEY